MRKRDNMISTVPGGNNQNPTMEEQKDLQRNVTVAAFTDRIKVHGEY